MSVYEAKNKHLNQTPFDNTTTKYIMLNFPPLFYVISTSREKKLFKIIDFPQNTNCLVYMSSYVFIKFDIVFHSLNWVVVK